MVARKVTKNAPGTPRTPIFAQSVCINGETALPLNFVLFLIYSLVVNDTPPVGLLKGDMFLGVLNETWFLGCNRGSIHRNSRQVSSMRGIPKGASPLCVVAGVGFIGEGPHRKGPAPMRPFAYFSGEGKVGRGVGLEAPHSNELQSSPLCKITLPLCSSWA